MGGIEFLILLYITAPFWIGIIVAIIIYNLLDAL